MHIVRFHICNIIYDTDWHVPYTTYEHIYIYTYIRTCVNIFYYAFMQRLHLYIYIVVYIRINSRLLLNFPLSSYYIHYKNHVYYVLYVLYCSSYITHKYVNFFIFYSYPLTILIGFFNSQNFIQI